MSFSSSVAQLVNQSQSNLVGAAPWWGRVALGDAATILNGAPWKSVYFNDQDGVPVIRIRDVTSGVTATRYSGPIEEGYWIEDGDLLVGMDGDFNSRIWTAGKAILNQRVCKITPNEDVILKSFLATVLPGYLQLINDETHSITVKHLSSKTLAEIPLPLPPLPEQRRIVAKIENLSARLRRASDDLDHIARLVGKYKQAILAAGYADALRRSEQAATLGSISLEVRNGLSKKPSDDPSGFPILRISAVRSMTVRLQDVRYYPETVPETALVRDGDLLFTRYNGNPDFTAVCGMVQGLTCHTAYPDKLIRVRLSKAAYPKFVDMMAAAKQSRDWLMPHIKTAAGQHGISGADLKLLPIPLPSILQQQTIARRIETAFAWIDRVASETTSARKLIDHLDQAIHSKAFRGELVPQDPSDEPAIVLLERIRAERAAQLRPKAQKGGTTKRNARLRGQA